MDTIQSESSKDEEGDAQTPKPTQETGQNDRDQDANESDADTSYSKEGGQDVEEGITDQNFADNLRDITDTNDYNNPTCLLYTSDAADE